MWSQLIWLDPANWSGTPLLSPDSVPPRADPSQATSAVEVLSSHSSDEEEEEDDEDGHGGGRFAQESNNEYDFLDEINEEEQESDTYGANATEEGVWHEMDGSHGNDEDEEDENRIQGSWDLISYLPAAASVYLRHTIGQSPLFLLLIAAADQFLLVYQEQWTLCVEEIQARNEARKVRRRPARLLSLRSLS
jgi:hypothetical protein